MNTPVVHSLFLFMAATAIDGIKLIGVGEFNGCIRVAGGACIAVMNRTFKNGWIDKHGYRASISFCSQIRITMTHQAIVIGLGESLTGEYPNRKSQKENNPSEAL